MMWWGKKDFMERYPKDILHGVIVRVCFFPWRCSMWSQELTFSFCLILGEPCILFVHKGFFNHFWASLKTYYHPWVWIFHREHICHVSHSQSEFQFMEVWSIKVIAVWLLGSPLIVQSRLDLLMGFNVKFEMVSLLQLRVFCLFIFSKLGLLWCLWALSQR